MSDKAMEMLCITLTLCGGLFTIIAAFAASVIRDCFRLWSEAVKAKYRRDEPGKGGAA